MHGCRYDGMTRLQMLLGVLAAKFKRSTAWLYLEGGPRHIPSSSISFLCATSSKCWPIGACTVVSLPSFSDTKVTVMLQQKHPTCNAELLRHVGSCHGISQ
jgi:hypothetical protein